MSSLDTSSEEFDDEVNFDEIKVVSQICNRCESLSIQFASLFAKIDIEEEYIEFEDTYWSCLNCKEVFVLCNSCEEFHSKGETHDISHMFVKIRFPCPKEFLLLYKTNKIEYPLQNGKPYHGKELTQVLSFSFLNLVKKTFWREKYCTLWP